MFKIKILFFFLVTTTPTISRCNFSCVNQTWSSSRLAQWLFDESFFDQMNNYHITPMTEMLFTKNGYVNQAVICNSDVSQILTAPHIPLSSTSFTIDMWLYITELTKTINLYGVFGICSQMNISNCLHILIRQNKSNYYLYMGFGDRDCIGVTPLTTKEWIHATFVFDLTTLTQKIYLNGAFENSSIVSFTPNITEGNTTIGSVPLFSRYPDYAPFQGYIDQMTVSDRAKSSYEILEIATLVARFSFDNGSYLTDSGPNSLQATTQMTSSISSGCFCQAIAFNGSTSSYFQMSGFTALGISNKPFSISIWIRPTRLSGIVLYVAATASGVSSWYMPFLGFAIDGSFVVQIWNGAHVISLVDPTFSVLTSVWSHVVQTWSSTNGLCLYINNILVARLNSATTYAGSSTANYLTLGNRFNHTTTSGLALVTGLPYQGDMDEFRVYSRELSAGDVSTLFMN